MQLLAPIIAGILTVVKLQNELQQEQQQQASDDATNFPLTKRIVNSIFYSSSLKLIPETQQSTTTTTTITTIIPMKQNWLQILTSHIRLASMSFQRWLQPFDKNSKCLIRNEPPQLQVGATFINRTIHYVNEIVCSYTNLCPTHSGCVERSKQTYPFFISQRVSNFLNLSSKQHQQCPKATHPNSIYSSLASMFTRNNNNECTRHQGDTQSFSFLEENCTLLTYVLIAIATIVLIRLLMEYIRTLQQLIRRGYHRREQQQRVFRSIFNANNNDRIHHRAIARLRRYTIIQATTGAEVAFVNNNTNTRRIINSRAKYEDLFPIRIVAKEECGILKNSTSCTDTAKGTSGKATGDEGGLDETHRFLSLLFLDQVEDITTSSVPDGFALSQPSSCESTPQRQRHVEDIDTDRFRATFDDNISVNENYNIQPNLQQPNLDADDDDIRRNQQFSAPEVPKTSASLYCYIAGQTCPICLSIFEANDHTTSCYDGCRNWFHKECLFEWLDRSTNCPYCRKQLLEPTTQEGENDNDRQQQQRPDDDLLDNDGDHILVEFSSFLGYYAR